MIVNNTTVCCSGPPTDGVANLHRIDLATGVDTAMNPFPAYNGGIISVSPDGNYVYGYLNQYQANGYSWSRAFIAPITGATPGASPSFAPNYGAGSSTQYSDYSLSPQWVTGSSAVVLPTSAYTNSAGVLIGGELKVWLRNQPSATTLSGYQTYSTSGNFGSLQVVGNVALFADTTDKNLKVVSLDQTIPISITLDTSGKALAARPWTVHGTTEYIVWAQQNSSGGVGKILATNISVPLTTAPVVQLGTDVSPSCAFEGVLSNTRFYELCSDTGQLTAFDQNTSSPSG